jgi:hypothetical protein
LLLMERKTLYYEKKCVLIILPLINLAMPWTPN